MVHYMGNTGSEGDSVTIFSTNNINYFISNTFGALGEYSTHWLVFFISLFFTMILVKKSNN